MSITFGVVLRVDRGPAVAIPPPQHVIEGSVVSQTTRPLPPVSPISLSQFNITNKNPRAPQQYLQTYTPRGEQQLTSEQTGSRLDIFA